MQIEKSTAKRLYDGSPRWFQEQLETEFGKEFFQKKSFKDVKSFEDACKELDIDTEKVMNYNDQTETQA